MIIAKKNDIIFKILKNKMVFKKRIGHVTRYRIITKKYSDHTNVVVAVVVGGMGQRQHCLSPGIYAPTGLLSRGTKNMKWPLRHRCIRPYTISGYPTLSRH
jgi:hypothetical protein